jgi:FAD/FMN-containing dehydrogenase/Fe-S oxidoreductase
MISAPPTPEPAAVTELSRQLDGALLTDLTSRRLYATDASEYQELPLAVARPRHDADVATVLRWAGQHGIGVIARGAGTSLAGQVVGAGIVLDLGFHMHAVLAIEPGARRVRVQPGVVRNALNLELKPHHLFFAPETATANRAMIGGMVGNNSCGANSIVYGTTREHLVAVRGFLSDGSEVTFGPLTPEGFAAKCAAPDSLETRIYRTIAALLGDPEHRAQITASFPKSTVTRRNTGYALDRLMACSVFDPEATEPFNLCRLLAGSEGTLFVGVEYELNCEPLPPPGGLLCAHFDSVDDALRATLIAMRHRPFGCELIDRHILDCTKANLEQARNRFFVEGDPGAILVVELRDVDRTVLERGFAAIEAECRASGLGYAFPVLWGHDGDRVWELRRAGQGLMSNIPGDAKPREVVEDTAVAVEDLPAYIAEFDELLRTRYGVSCVYYAHAGAGELHTRPLFDLKTAEGLRMFRGIATDVAALVKRYRGSLSGEHGDGRLRGEFIPFMVGASCYAMMRQVKAAFDPMRILNPGKIIDTPPLETALRYGPDHPDPRYLTVLDFSAVGGILRATEQCNGVGECRKSARMGGTMCPSFMATGDERDSTRGRANLLRQVLTEPPGRTSPWESPEVEAVMDLCLSCKACKSECPSSVDVARLKAEWQQQHHDRTGVPLRTRLIAAFAPVLRTAGWVAPLANALIATPAVAAVVRWALGLAPGRSLPRVAGPSLRRWHRRHGNPDSLDYPHGMVHLFCDEFTDTVDVAVGIAAIELLNRLGWRVEIPAHADSGRAQISMGMLRDARQLADRNVRLLAEALPSDRPILGIEPSAILGFRDEYPDLVSPPLRDTARALAGRALLIDEFLTREATAGRVTAGNFDTVPRRIALHGHCHQKALASLAPTVAILSLPTGHRVEEIPSGCCGMAGSFGYGRDHFAVSMQIGELVLLPAVREAAGDTVIAAGGTSCRHQILDGTDRRAVHPVEILRDALV